MATNGSRISDIPAGLEAEAGRFNEQVDALRDYAGSADEVIREFARERPVAAIAMAVGVGFLLGRLASRL
jgi:ElaB/YqjD/DUF883 family membrane-anchored ribosome-binding protein